VLLAQWRFETSTLPIAFFVPLPEYDDGRDLEREREVSLVCGGLFLDITLTVGIVGWVCTLAVGVVAGGDFRTAGFVVGGVCTIAA
jgi:hypothetical protein